MAQPDKASSGSQPWNGYPLLPNVALIYPAYDNDDEKISQIHIRKSPQSRRKYCSAVSNPRRTCQPPVRAAPAQNSSSLTQLGVSVAAKP